MRIERAVRIALLFSTAVLLGAVSLTNAQDRRFAMDEPVAKVTTGDLGSESVIRYSDVLTQLALQPTGTIDPPISIDFDAALQTVVNQRLLEHRAMDEAMAFEWIPSDKDIDRELQRIMGFFRTATDFQTRLKVVGFESLKDERLFRVITRRLYIEWYLEVHFRRHLRPTREVEEKYYNETFVPEFRRQNPGLLRPTFEEKRSEITQIIIKIVSAQDIDRYLKRAKERARIEILVRL